jgi:hypothetical protein
VARGQYKNLLISVTDNAQEAIDTVLAFSGKETTAGC